MHMNCNEARRMITAYVKKELSEKELEAFLHHIAHCSDCMDELDTYYTVYQALDLLDSGDHHDYDFRRMLSDDIRASWRRLRRRRVLGAVGGILLVLTECLLIGSAYTGYELKQGQTEYTTIQRAQAGNEVVERIQYYARKDRFDRWTQHFKPCILRASDADQQRGKAYQCSVWLP